MTLGEREFLVLTTGLTGHDGLARFSWETFSALGSLVGEANVSCWSLRDSPHSLAGVSTRARGASGSRSRLALWSLRERARRGTALDLVVLHVHLLPLALLMGSRVRELTHVLIGIEVWKELSFLQARGFTKADRRLSISNHTADRFKMANPALSEHSIAVCHPGIAWRELTRSSIPAASREGRASRAILVARMAVRERYKGHDLLLELWPSVSAEIPDAELVFVGDGDDRRRLEAKRDRLGLQGQVRFVGQVPDAELGRLYEDVTVFVMPSRDEGFGLVFVEAMRAGLPCIGATGAAGEIIDHGETGYVLPHDDRDALLRCLIRIFRDSELQHSMGVRGRERFEAEFSDVAFRRRLAAALELDD